MRGTFGEARRGWGGPKGDLCPGESQEATGSGPRLPGSPPGLAHSCPLQAPVKLSSPWVPAFSLPAALLNVQFSKHMRGEPLSPPPTLAQGRDTGNHPSGRLLPISPSHVSLFPLPPPCIGKPGEESDHSFWSLAPG